jgi:EmrB/QacA subfamily drug resistance transporter
LQISDAVRTMVRRSERRSPSERRHLMNRTPLAPDPGPAEPATIDEARQRRSVLIAVCVALMAVIAAVTGLNVAQQQIAVDLDASQSQVLWMINIYTVTLAALLLPLGALGDRLGRRPMLLTGLTVFGIATAAAGLAPSTEVMVGARFASGVGAAMIMPVTLAVITSTFPEQERSKAIGVWTAVAGGGGVIGMFLSAILVDTVSWRWLFVLPVVLVAVAAALALRSVPNSREAVEHRFDLGGSVASLITVVGLILLLHEGPEQGWTAPVTLASLAVGVLGAIAFATIELRHPAPLLDIGLFRQRGLSSGSITLLAVFGVQAGIFVVLFPFFQAVLGWSGIASTFALMPMAGLMMVSSGLAPQVAGRVGARATMATGVVLSASGLALMATFVSVDGGYLSVLPGMLAMGLGMGLSMMPSTEAITSSLDRDRQGVASALNDVTRELGTALGVALLGALVTTGYRSAIDGRLDGVPAGLADTAREGIANALGAASGAGTDSGTIVEAAQQSFVDGWQQGMWAGAVVMAALFVFIVFRGPLPRPSEGEGDEVVDVDAVDEPGARWSTRVSASVD